VIEFWWYREKVWLRPIPIMKMDGIGVNEFLFIRKVYTRYFFSSLNLSKMVKNFGFELIVSFGANFQVVTGYDYVLQDVYDVFFSC